MISKLLFPTQKLCEEELLKYLIVADISDEVCSGLIGYMKTYDFHYADSNKAEKFMIEHRLHKMFAAYCVNYKLDMDLQMALVQSHDVELISAYVQHQSLCGRAVTVLFGLTRGDFVNYLLIKKPELTALLRSYDYLDKDVMIEDEEIFQNEFINLLKNCYSHAPFYDETSNWTYDKHVERGWCVEIVTVTHPLAEDKFIEYVHMHKRRDLFKEYIDRYEFSADARLTMVLTVPYKPLLDLYLKYHWFHIPAYYSRRWNKNSIFYDKRYNKYIR